VVSESTGIPAGRQQASKLVSLICWPTPWSTAPVDEERKLDWCDDTQDDH
jgi:hypothetical protein